MVALAEGTAPNAVAAKLNADELNTKQDRRWHHTTVAKLVGEAGAAHSPP